MQPDNDRERRSGDVVRSGNAANRQELCAACVECPSCAGRGHICTFADGCERESRYREALESIELSASASQGNASDRFASIRRTVREALA